MVHEINSNNNVLDNLITILNWKKTKQFYELVSSCQNWCLSAYFSNFRKKKKRWERGRRRRRSWNWWKNAHCLLMYKHTSEKFLNFLHQKHILPFIFSSLFLRNDKKRCFVFLAHNHLLVSLSIVLYPLFLPLSFVSAVIITLSFLSVPLCPFFLDISGNVVLKQGNHFLIFSCQA